MYPFSRGCLIGAMQTPGRRCESRRASGLLARREVGHVACTRFAIGEADIVCSS